MNDPYEFIDHLILNGALEPGSINEDGEIMFSFTEKLKEVDPELHQAIIDDLYRMVMLLWQKDFIDLDILSDDPRITPTPKAASGEEREDLSPLEIAFLNEILRLSQVE